MRRLIVETDIFSDVDDVGALAVAHALADEDRCQLAAIGVNTPSIYGVGAARAVNAFFGRPDIPVGRFAEQDDSVFAQDYAKFLNDNYPVPRGDDLPATTVHRAGAGGRRTGIRHRGLPRLLRKPARTALLPTG